MSRRMTDAEGAVVDCSSVESTSQELLQSCSVMSCDGMS